MSKKLHYFSEGEEKKQEVFSSKRTKILEPLLKILNKIGLTPDIVSYLGIFLLIPFSWLFIKNPIIATIVVWTYVLFDGIDGSLARYQKTENPGGSFTDIVADQLGLIVIVGNLIYYGVVDPTIGYIYGILYVIMIAFSVVQTSLGIPLQMLVRTKYVIYAIYSVFAIFGNNISYDSGLVYGVCMGVFSLIMIYTSVISYNRLKEYLKNS